MIETKQRPYRTSALPQTYGSSICKGFEMERSGDAGTGICKTMKEKTTEKQDKPAATDDIVDTIDESALKSMSKEEKTMLFLRSCGNMHIDVQAIDELRKRSAL